MCRSPGEDRPLYGMGLRRGRKEGWPADVTIVNCRALVGRGMPIWALVTAEHDCEPQRSRGKRLVA